MRIANVVIVAFILLAGSRAQAKGPPYWPCHPGDGMPFGKLTEADSQQLVELAKEHGLELIPTLQKVYEGDKGALANFFRLSRELKALDLSARVYGHMVYSTFLNVGEAKGPDFIISVVTAQEPDIRQRIRDFLWYPMFCQQDDQRAAEQNGARSEFPALFPPEYKFGEGDSLFSKSPNSAVSASHSGITRLAQGSKPRGAGRARYAARWVFWKKGA